MVVEWRRQVLVFSLHSKKKRLGGSSEVMSFPCLNMLPKGGWTRPHKVSSSIPDD